jgi:hypothetical protein
VHVGLCTDKICGPSNSLPHRKAGSRNWVNPQTTGIE